MTLPLATAIVLALAASLACLRTWLQWRRQRGTLRAWRVIALLLAQPLFAVLLYFALHPPLRTAPGSGTATVLTAGTSVHDALAARDRGPVLALPEAPRIDGIARVPDLGTALRRHPGVRAVRVIGAGLAARDRDAARDAAIVPALSPLPRGLAALDVPARVATGEAFVAAGSVTGVAGGRVELADPAGRRIDAAPLGDDGAFALQGRAFAAGPSRFTLRILDARGAVVETGPVPLWAFDDAAPRVWLLAGAPNPETRALRRWMQDAGHALHAQIALGGGMQLGDRPLPMSAETLSKFDLLVVDARAWTSLGDAGRTRVLQAVDAGLGLLVRADTPMPSAAVRALHAPGFDIGGGGATSAFRLPAPRVADEAALRARLGAGTVDAPVDLEQAGEALPEFMRRAWRVTGDAAVPLASDARGVPLGWWHAHGQGRVGVWTPVDSWRLPLLGRSDLHADLWRAAFAALVRARPLDAARIEGESRVGVRVAICDVREGAAVETPDGEVQPLLPDPQAAGCAAFWPVQPGWHRLRDGERTQPFHVLATEAWPGMHAAAMREATLRLAARPPTAAGGDAGVAYRTSPWPWFLAWLLLAAALWWFERARAGRGGQATATG